jgi:RND family efflux transporter MFP subunit
MKRQFVYLLSAVAALLSIVACSAPEPESAAFAPPALTVKPVFASEQQWPQALSAVGTVAAWQEVVIAAEIGGQRLSRLLVEIGDQVQQGQLLAQLNAGTLEAELNASRAALQEAEAQARELARAAQRARSLADAGVLSAQAMEQALAANESAQARLAAARARVQADTLRLSYTQVRAPDHGVISARSAVEGALVQEGGEILRLQRQGRLEWRAELPDRDLAHVAPGQTVRLALADRNIEGCVRLISPQIDSQSRTGLVYVDLEPDPQLRAGLFARGDFLLGESTVLTLPETAVLLRDGLSYVFRLEGDRVRQQKVTLGARRGDLVEIREGLDADTAVVESGVGFLADGLRVRLADHLTLR